MNAESFMLEYTKLTSLDLNDLIIKFVFSLVIIIIGVVLGKIISFGIKKISNQLQLTQHIKGSFVDLTITIIRWSIYLVFTNLALNQLEIPILTKFFGAILVTIPAFTGALILLLLGFSIAYYLKRIILNSEIKSAEPVSLIFFYFVLYLFGIYSIKTALISFNSSLSMYVILLFSAALFFGIAYNLAKKHSI